jgi:molybdenum cofactor cytidylyltransferase
MTYGIVLAAGASSRMGRPKALLTVRGRPAVEIVCENLRDAGVDDVVVVLGRHAEEIRAAADLRTVRLVDNPAWPTGRTSSIQAGIAALPSDAAWTLLALVDMPLVRLDTIRALVAAAETSTAEVVAPVHDGRRGHPIALRRPLFDRIAGLGPDEPLRDALRSASRRDVSVDDRGVLVDLDEPADAERELG